MILAAASLVAAGAPLEAFSGVVFGVLAVALAINLVAVLLRTGSIAGGAGRGSQLGAGASAEDRS